MPDHARLNGEAGRDSRLREGTTSPPPASLAEPLLRARDVADRLNVSTATVLDWWEAGRLPGFKLNGGPVRFSGRELDEWVAAQHREAT